MKMDHVYDIRFILAILSLTLVISGLMNILYRFTVVRYVIVLAYGIIVLIIGSKNKDKIMGIFRKKKQA